VLVLSVIPPATGYLRHVLSIPGATLAHDTIPDFLAIAYIPNLLFQLLKTGALICHKSAPLPN
jgi:hypothetical protein